MAINFVQSAHNGGTTTALVVTLATAPVNGNALIMVVGDNNSVITGITQTGATWVKDIQTIAAPLQSSTQVWRAQNVSGAGTTITVHASASDLMSAVVMEFSGLGSAGIIDQTAFISATPVVGSTLNSGNTSNSTIANELWITGWTQGGTNTFSAPTNGFTGLVQDAGGITTGMSYNIVQTIGSASSSVTTSGTNVGSYEGVVATYGVPVVCPVFMTGEDLITELRDRFAEINFVTWITDLDLIRWINLGLDDIVFRTLPPRNEAVPFTFTGTPGTFTYPLPGNWFRNKQFGDSGGFYVTGPNYFVPLLQEDKTDDLEEDLSEGSQPGAPVRFWIWNQKLYVHPIPDIAYNFKLYYYRLPIYICQTSDALDLDRPWIETLIKFVLWKALEKDKHPQAQYYKQEYEQSLSTMYSESRIKVEKRARYVHSHDFYGGDGR